LAAILAVETTRPRSRGPRDVHGGHHDDCREHHDVLFSAASMYRVITLSGRMMMRRPGAVA